MTRNRGASCSKSPENRGLSEVVINACAVNSRFRNPGRQSPGPVLLPLEHWAQTSLLGRREEGLEQFPASTDDESRTRHASQFNIVLCFLSFGMYLLLF
jgi:hypothetical protein